MNKLDGSARIGFIGAGKVGGSLGVAMAQAGYSVVAVASRTAASAAAFAARIDGCHAYGGYQDALDACDMAFVTTSDDAIADVVSSVRWRAGQGVAHCSGAASLDVLQAAARQGAVAGAFHPLQAFSSVENGIKSIPGITFGIEGGIEGGGEMREYLAKLARDIGGNAVFLKAEDKALYHLSGVMMGNLLTCLVGISAEIWEHIGYTRDDGVRALVPMMRAVAQNIETSGIPAAVAGPYPRGDLGTVRKHIDNLQARHPALLPLYRELALAGLHLAVEQGLTDEGAGEFRDILTKADTEADDMDRQDEEGTIV